MSQHKCKTSRNAVRKKLVHQMTLSALSDSLMKKENMDVTSQLITDNQLLTRKMVCFLFGISKSLFYMWVDPSSESYRPGFPAPVYISRNSPRWELREIVKYVEKLKSEGRPSNVEVSEQTNCAQFKEAA